ncbi:AAA domain-containing protein [Sphaerisporangium melleum]|uniref:AAA domain-containing protein n=1 Tax=Sphaerisporangium melleum TaxID=321316 RepID=UPI001E5CF77E|nr:AAA domain-containing protein [Sphaerisporangium melleum]
MRDHDRVLWLADLPTAIQADRTAGHGEVVLSVQRERSVLPPAAPDVLSGWLRQNEVADPGLTAPPLAGNGPEKVMETGEDGELRLRPERQDDRPDVVEGYRRWLPRWQEWAEQERERRRRQDWHRDLYSVHTQLGPMEDEMELVLAVGLLSWIAPDGTRVRNHLIRTRVHLRVDPDTERMDVVLGETSPVLQDRELLADLPGVTFQRSERLRERVREGEGVGLQDSVVDVLKSWCDRGLEATADYQSAWEPPSAATGPAEVRFAPALVLRKRDRGSLISYYDAMMDTLTGPDPQAPLGFAQLVSALEPAERMAFLRERATTSRGAIGEDPLFPLPANPEQRKIMERLRGSNGVVVQGPPGTGKTHSIANLLSALLAQGQRVLVTSQKAQALRVLRDKLPEEIAKLCVSMTDLGRGGSPELEGGIKALSARFSGFDAEHQARVITEKRHQLDSARRRIANLTERVRALRESETYVHPEVAPGYSGTLTAIVGRLHKEETHCGWMPLPPATAPVVPPFSVGEAAELVELLTTETPQRRARQAQRIPDVSALPAVETVRGLIAAEQAAQASAREARTEISARLEHLDISLLAHLDRVASDGTRLLRELGLPDDAEAWDLDDWTVRALMDILARRETAIWDQLAAHAARLADARRAVETLGFRRIDYPSPQVAGGAAAVLRSARALHDHLAAGHQLKRGPFRPAVQKQAEPWLNGTLVDGVVPSNPELLTLVIADLEGRVAVEELSRGWALVGVEFPADLPLQRTVARLTDAYDKLGHIRQLGTAVAETSTQLVRAGVHLPLRTPRAWTDYTSALRAVRLIVEAERATAELDALHTRLRHEIGLGPAAPELSEAARALAARDATTYQLCLNALASAHRELADQRRCDELAGLLRATHPALLEMLRQGGWRPEFSTWDRAWAWAKAQAFFTEQRRPGLEQRLEADLEAATAQGMRITAELAAEQAWEAALGRMNSSQTTALKAYQDHMAKLGKGTGKHAGRYLGYARDAMADARDAVPAWIMPLRQVLETIPPVRDSFDVVIVDEASQAGIEALFLLWLAPRVIVVGDDKQCAPSAITHGELDPIFAKLSSYLPDMPAYLRDAFTPNSSLFDLLAIRFGSVLPLKEHFRCMPEIIDFSSRQFYSDEPLIPLRQFGADRLPPLKVVRVHEAYTEGSDARLRNRVEAEAIVARIVECAGDPAYDGRTFGVVVLQGSGQVNLIHNMLLDRMDTKEWSRRRLRVGTPPDFQGDERDVVFLSMVVAERRSALTSTEWRRRFNVAASRAKDQMWLFHSVSPDLLSPACLRRSLLTYMANPPAPLMSGTLADVTPDDRHPDFDSLFEQRVFLRIRERGYHVIPQFEVNGRRIDLVVSGAKGRLAVECDGDFWHGTPEQRDQDLDRERELKRAGWRFWRVRESEFSFDPDAALLPLWDELARRGIAPGEVLGEATVDATAPTWSALELPAGDALETERAQFKQYEPTNDDRGKLRISPPDPAIKPAGQGYHA